MKLLGTLLLATTLPLHAQSPTTKTFRLEVDGEAAHQPSWIILVHSDGTGLYWPSLADKYGARPIHISPSTWQQIEAAAPTIESGHCETKLKNIANTGSKNAEYHPGTAPDTNFACDFNYSDDPALQHAADLLSAMAETIRTGDQLGHLHRFDRLGLDEALTSFTREVEDNRAIELENIAPTLHSIADDDRVIARTRHLAAILAAQADREASGDK